MEGVRGDEAEKVDVNYMVDFAGRKVYDVKAVIKGGIRNGMETVVAQCDNLKDAASVALMMNRARAMEAELERLEKERDVLLARVGELKEQVNCYAKAVEQDKEKKDNGTKAEIDKAKKEVKARAKVTAKAKGEGRGAPKKAKVEKDEKAAQKKRSVKKGAK